MKTLRADRTINKKKSTIMKLILHTFILMAPVLTAIPSLSIAHGKSGDRMSSVETNHHDCHHDRYRYSDIYSCPPYGAYAVSYYDADYSYTPTAEQMATAQEQVHNYLLAVKKGRKHAATHRYISVEALRPTKSQLADYTKKQLPQPAEPSQMRCLMVFDTQAKQFVGSNCYVVTAEPSIGDVAKFGTVSAEFVGQ
jgi:hypothetical protein